METTRLSTKGQIIVPKNVRISKAWRPGMEFTVEEAGDGILVRPSAQFPETKLADVAGCLRFEGRPKTLKQMDMAIGKEVARRHGRGRY